MTLVGSWCTILGLLYPRENPIIFKKQADTTFYYVHRDIYGYPPDSNIIEFVLLATGTDWGFSEGGSESGVDLEGWS